MSSPALKLARAVPNKTSMWASSSWSAPNTAVSTTAAKNGKLVGHKQLCQDQYNKHNWSAKDKMQDFENRLHPLMSMLVVSVLQVPTFHNKQERREAWLGDSHYVQDTLIASPLPTSPVPLQIQSFTACRITDQPPAVQALVQRVKPSPPHPDAADATTVALCDYEECRYFPMGFWHKGYLDSPMPWDNSLSAAEQERFQRDMIQYYHNHINTMATGIAPQMVPEMLD